MEKQAIPVRFVLSGGGTRGFAHLGMIAALIEFGCKPTAYCGASAGAVAGAFLSAGYKPEEVLGIFQSMKPSTFASIAFNEGLLSTKSLTSFFEKHLPATFEDLLFPLCIVATDLSSGNWKSFHSGELKQVLAGSCAIPGLFKPVVFKDMLLADGGILNNLPVEAVPEAEGKVAGLHVNPVAQVDVSSSAFRILERTFHLGVYSNTIFRTGLCDSYLEPRELAGYRVFDFSSLKEVYQIGYDYVLSDAARILEELSISYSD